MLEVPALGRIQKEYKERSVEVIAVNIYRGAPLDYWREYLQKVGAGDLTYAEDTNREAIRTLNIQTSGATVVIDRQRRIVFRDQYATSYELLKEAVEKAL